MFSALLGVMLASVPARAQPGPDEDTAVAELQALIDRADPVFADYVVNPIASVLFQDVVFWDDGRSRVLSVVSGSDGTLYSGGADGRLVVWDGHQVRREHAYEAPIAALAVRPGGSRELAIALGAGPVRLIREDGTVTRTFEGLDGTATHLAFDPDGTTLVAGSSRGMVRTWSLFAGGPSKVLFREPGRSIEALAVSSSTASEPMLAFSARPREVLKTDLSGGPTEVLKGHRRGVSAFAFGPRGELASGGEDGRVLIYPADSDRAFFIVGGSEASVVALGWSDPDTLVVARPGAVGVYERGADTWAASRSLKTEVVSFDVDRNRAVVTVGRSQGQVQRFYLVGGRPPAVLAGHSTEVALPFIVLWLVSGAVFFTFRFGFVNLRAFRHALDVTRGKYDADSEEGDVSHFQALAMALSATVGLGNIAGVAIAVGTGGPGAVLWMIIAGFLGMSSKFAECTLGQMYRTKDREGKVTGGPMHYLKKGIAELGMPRLGRTLSVLFAVLCILGSLGGGNMFQANQSYAQVASVVPILQGEIGALVYGLLLSGLVGIVIIGGINRIGQVASLVVPFMVGIYILAALFIVIVNFDKVPSALAEIVRSAVNPEAAFGGAVGVMVTGFRRAAFSNEAGVGSASIAHSAACTQEPVREGIVALLEPFIDTIVVCTTTALVLVITGAYRTEADGVVMTSAAFATVLPWFPVVLTFAVFLFAFSTMISWSYYGERCWGYLFGDGSSLIYKVLFVMAVVVGSVVQLGSVITFSDLMILAMAFPNILGAMLLSGKVRARLQDYMTRLRRGEMRVRGRGHRVPS